VFSSNCGPSRVQLFVPICTNHSLLPHLYAYRIWQVACCLFNQPRPKAQWFNSFPSNWDKNFLLIYRSEPQPDPVVRSRLRCQICIISPALRPRTTRGLSTHK
jgi:hypothetical protein